ncbi:MAG TPA: hypothetical protein VF462_10825 [Micromonosporaceae bacterium]
MPSVEEVKAHVAASVDQTHQAVAALRGVTDQVDEALVRLRLTAVGSAHPLIAEAVARLEQARSRLDEAHGLALAAVDSADAYRMLV